MCFLLPDVVYFVFQMVSPAIKKEENRLDSGEILNFGGLGEILYGLLLLKHRHSSDLVMVAGF